MLDIKNISLEFYTLTTLSMSKKGKLSLDKLLNTQIHRRKTMDIDMLLKDFLNFFNHQRLQIRADGVEREALEDMKNY